MANEDTKLPLVPGVDDTNAKVSVPSLRQVKEDIGNLGDNVTKLDLKWLLKSPSVPPRTALRYIIQGDGGIKQLETEIRADAAKEPTGKFSKGTVEYLPQTPAPFGAWEYKCKTCRFYTDPDDSPDGDPRCQVVGRDGDLFGDENVHPDAWCSLWLPRDDRAWFEFISDRLEGSSI